MSDAQEPTTPHAQRRADERQTRIVLDHMPVMLAAFSPDGRIVFWNRECERVLGFSAGEVIDHPAGAALVVPDAAYLQQMIDEWSRRGNDYRDWQWEMVCKDGTKRIVSWSNVSARAPVEGWEFWTVGTDTTQSTDVFESLRRTEARFKAFMDNIPCVAFIKDSQGRLVYVNRVWEQVFCFRSNEVLGRSMSEIFPPEVAERLRANDAQVLNESRVLQVCESVPTPDGVERQWLAIKFPLDDGQNNVLIGGVAIDLSERLRTEAALREAHDRLALDVDARTADLITANHRLQEEVDRRRWIEEDLRRQHTLLERLVESHERERHLASYDIHDGIVQYLAGALMHLESSAIANGAGDRDFERALFLLRRTINEARRLISGLRPPILDELGLVPAIDYLVREERELTSAEIVFRNNDDWDWLPKATAVTLFRVCQESLTNARRYSSAGQVEITLERSGHTIRLDIRDDGRGFDPHRVPAASFGLHGIRQRARLLRGRATIESSPGSGTRVCVELPAELGA